MNDSNNKSSKTPALPIHEDVAYAHLKTLLAEKPETPIRSTFTLTSRATKILYALAKQKRWAAREVFDTALNANWIEQVVKFAKEEQTPEQPSHRKTLVLSKKTLNEMNELCKANGIKRDHLANAVIEFMLMRYNESVVKAKSQWGEVARILEKALSLIDTSAAHEYVGMAPPEIREGIDGWLLDLWNQAMYLFGLGIHDENAPLGVDLPEELANIRSIAENLKPIELEDDSK